MAKKNKWQNDGCFCGWLIKVQYARYNEKGSLEPYLSDGMVIYMWESFKEGQRVGPSEPTSRSTQP
jgi:hypothetical protein